jgi:hypothetical protein
MPASISGWKSSVQATLDAIPAADAAIYRVCNTAAVREVGNVPGRDVVGGRMEALPRLFPPGIVFSLGASYHWSRYAKPDDDNDDSNPRCLNGWTDRDETSGLP